MHRLLFLGVFGSANFVRVLIGAGSRSHPVRLGISPVSMERTGTCSSTTSWFDSGPSPSKILFMLLRSSSIFNTKSTRIGITFVAETGCIARLLFNNRVLFRTLSGLLTYSSNFWLRRREALSLSMAIRFFDFYSSRLFLSLLAFTRRKLFLASSSSTFFRDGRLSIVASRSFGLHFPSFL